MSLKYVSLHNHTTLSIYDALGYPKDFFEYVLSQGGDGLAITDHGHMNGLGYSYSAAQDLKSKGVNFRPIYGVEAYIHPSLSDWHKAYEDKDNDNNLVIEDEQESKSKWYDPIKRRHHLVITALNNTGLQNLFTLVSLSYRRENFYRFPRMDFDMLRKYNDGLAISTACLAGLPTYLALRDPDANMNQVYDQELLPLLEIFGKDRAFLELQFNALPEQSIVNHKLIEYHKHSGYNLIVASDAHYCRPDLWKEREIYKSLGRQMMKSGMDLAASIPQNIEDLKCELYPHSADQIYGAYEKYFRQDDATDQVVKDAINRTHDIAWQLMGEVNPDAKTKLPKFVPISDGPATPFGQLKELCIKRLKEKGLDKNPVYIDRTVYELKIIKDKNIAEYFITKKSILDALRKHMLLGTGRGSGAGSIVNYLLDITLADPIKGGLLFERFISPSRAELPDIDSDCEDKDQAYEILKKEFGEENVLAISNYNTLKLKSLIKDVSKLYNVPFDVVNGVTKVMEDEAKDAIMEEIGNDQKLYEFTYDRALKHSPTFAGFIDTYPSVAHGLSTLYKSIKSIGRHAGGVLIVPEAHKHLPIIRVRNVLQSPFTEGLTAQHLKLFGLVKFDVLGLATLKIMRRCIELILKSWGVKDPTIDEVWDFYNQNLHPDVINPEDENVFKHVYHGGRFPSIFQFAERGVQSFVRRAKPNSVKDIAAITALFRPGPLKGKADERYLTPSSDSQSNAHPILQEVLGETRDTLLYQEQFMLLAHKLANFSLDEADKLRKLLVKPSAELSQEMRAQRIKTGERFIQGCMEEGLTRDRAHDLWHKEIYGFISYGFAKSHSYVYAYNSYQCAFLYTYYEEQWIKACLEKDPDLEKTIASVSTLGYEVCKPDINESLADEWQILGERCIPPLVAVKGIGKAAADELIRKRKDGFKSLDDFFYDKDDEGLNVWRWSKFNKKAIQNMVQLEAFDSLLCIGEDSVFKNYAHMERVIFGSGESHKTVVIDDDGNTEEWTKTDTGCFDKLKKGVITEGRGKKAVKSNMVLEALPGIDQLVEPWNNLTKIDKQQNLMGTFDKKLLFTSDQAAFINKYGLRPYTVVTDTSIQAVYFYVNETEEKKTKSGKPYLKLSISDGLGNHRFLNYFQEDLRIKPKRLYVGNMFMKDWFTNVEGKIHCI